MDVLHELQRSARMNLSAIEAILLVGVAGMAWRGRNKVLWLPVAYSAFLILYITLLRRSPGYDEHVRLQLQLLPNVGVLVGNLLNVVLYIPLGWTAAKWKRSSDTQSRKQLVLFGAFFSTFCELTQYFTGRGWADINDVLFNTLGMAVGLLLGSVH